jgi:hypothetical protein
MRTQPQKKTCPTVGQVERGLERAHKEIAYRPEPAEAQVNDNKRFSTCTVFLSPAPAPAVIPTFPQFAPLFPPHPAARRAPMSKV